MIGHGNSTARKAQKYPAKISAKGVCKAKIFCVC
jgi:hypothetical protein